MSNPDATKNVNEIPAVRTRGQTEKGLTYGLEILFVKGKGCCYDCKGSLKIKRTLWKISSMSGQFLKSWNKMMICQSCFQGFRVNKMGSLMITSRKQMIFRLMKLIKKSSLLSILYIIICKKIKRSCQVDLKILGKLNHWAQVLVLSLDNQGPTY